MDPWVWIAAYLIGFAVLQLVLYRYFRRDVPSGEAPTPSSHEAGTRPARTGSNAPADGELSCPRCGTVNEREATYTFCRECVEPL